MHKQPAQGHAAALNERIAQQAERIATLEAAMKCSTVGGVHYCANCGNRVEVRAALAPSVSGAPEKAEDS